jgi:ABC-type multidrug transport system fused ATPase/permease subunit
MSLKINANESVAIIGESGSGKSTIINLLMRFYDIDYGQILIDGIDIKDYEVKYLRERIGFVM